MNKLLFLLPLSCLILPGCAAVVVGAAATTAVAAQDRRTSGTIVEDKSIYLKATQAIHHIAKDEPEIHVTPVSYNGRVLLIGQVPSRAVSAEIEGEIKSLEKVDRVYNEIQVTAPTSLKQRSTDSWITTKVKTEMALTKDLNPTRIKVSTENGIVYLMGIVTSLEEEIAVDIARQAKGVKKVVKIFEYQN